LPPGWWWLNGKPVPPNPGPDKPGPTTPDKPGPTTPDKPGPTTPDKPGPTTPDKPGPTTPDKPGPTTPDKPGPTTPDKPGPTTPDKPGPTTPDKPNSLLSAVEALEKQHQDLDKSFKKESDNQGIIGSLVDGAKNHLGSTDENRDWCNPKALWSHFLDYNSGSQHTRDQLTHEADGLKQLRQAAERNDVPAFTTKYKELTGKDFDPKSIDATQLKANEDTNRFHQSQANGVEFVTDLGAGAAAAFAASRTGGLSLLPTLVLGKAAGAVTKAGLKQIDHQYASLGNDLFTGGLVGLSVTAGEFAGAGASRAVAGKFGLTVTGEGLAARIETQGLGLGNRLLSASTKAGTAGATFGAIDAPTREVMAAKLEGREVSFDDLVSRSLTGAAFGFVGGTVLGFAFDGAADGFKRSNPGPIKPITPKEINGVQIPSSNVVTLDQAAKIMGHDPADFAKMATDDPYAAARLAAKMFDEHGLNIQKFHPETGGVAVPPGFRDALDNAQKVDAFTTGSQASLVSKVDIVRSADDYISRNAGAVDESLGRLRADMNYKEIMLQKAQEPGDQAAREFEDKFTAGFRKDLTVGTALERMQNGGSTADSFARAQSNTEDAYTAKAFEFFKDIADPARRARLNELVDHVYEKFTPQYLTRQQVSDIISAFPEEDRQLAQAFLMRSASNSSDVGLRVKLQQIRPEVKTQVGSSAPDNVYTLTADSAGNAVGYLYRKSNSFGMSMRNIDKLADGPLPNSIVLFDDLSTVKLPDSIKYTGPSPQKAAAVGLKVPGSHGVEPPVSKPDMPPSQPPQTQLDFNDMLQVKPKAEPAPAGNDLLTKLDPTLNDMMTGNRINASQLDTLKAKIKAGDDINQAAMGAGLSPQAISELGAAANAAKSSSAAAMKIEAPQPPVSGEQGLPGAPGAGATATEHQAQALGAPGAAAAAKAPEGQAQGLGTQVPAGAAASDGKVNVLGIKAGPTKGAEAPPAQYEFPFEKPIPPGLPTGPEALAKIDGTLKDLLKSGKIGQLEDTMMRTELEKGTPFFEAAKLATINDDAFNGLLAALGVPARSPYEGIPAAQAAALNLSKEQVDLLRKIPNVYVVDLNAFEKGINVVDLARGPEAVTAKLKALVAEAKQNGTPHLLTPGLVQETLDGSVDKVAAAIGPNVKIIRAPGNYQITNAPSQAELAAMDPVDAIHRQLTIPKTTKSEIASFLSDYAGEDRELAAQMLANGAVNNSFTVMARKSIDVNNQIQQILRQNKGSLNDLSIVTDIDPGGSTHLISYYLGRVAGLPSDNFISTRALNRMVLSGAAKDKFVARLDDTVYSGDQTVSALNSNISGFMPFKKVVIGTLGAYEKGINKIENTHLGYLGKVATAYSERYHPFYSTTNPFYGGLTAPQQLRVENIGGYTGWGKVQGSLIWPYMYPDNNIDFFGPRFSGSVLHLPGP
jgi:hypothetical protein